VRGPHESAARLSFSAAGKTHIFAVQAAQQRVGKCVAAPGRSVLRDRVLHSLRTARCSVACCVAAAACRSCSSCCYHCPCAVRPFECPVCWLCQLSLNFPFATCRFQKTGNYFGGFSPAPPASLSALLCFALHLCGGAYYSFPREEEEARTIHLDR
jgi:hypothetical protein